MIGIGDLKKGVTIELDSVLYQVLDYSTSGWAGAQRRYA